MRNLELKARWADLARAESIAQTIGAKFAGELHQHDTYFHLPTGCFKLREFLPPLRGGRGAAVGVADELIFYERSENSATRLSDYFTAPVAADHSAAMRDVLTRALGVRQDVEKWRRLYLYSAPYQNARIHLDRVARLGTFLEFEVPTQSDDEAIARTMMAELMQAFGLTDGDAITASYSELMEKQP